MKSVMRKIGIAAFLGILLGCVSTQQVALLVVEPSEVVLSNQVVRVGVLAEEQQFDTPESPSGIERLVSIEDKWLVEKAQKASLAALIDELRADKRFEIVLLDPEENKLEKSEEEEAAASLAKLGSLCKKNKIEALFFLTRFDAETGISLRRTALEESNMIREKVTVSGQELTLETHLQNGWLIYDSFLQEIVDEYSYNQFLVSKAKGVNPLAALKAIGSRKDSLLHKGALLGRAYGGRLKPQEHKVFREYFVKGTDNFTEASTRMVSGDIKSAAQLWEKEVSHSNAKIRSRACHNLAVGMEVMGELNRARAWAVKANENLESETTLKYVKLLENRIKAQSKVDAQLVTLDLEDE